MENYEIRKSCQNIDFLQVQDILQFYGLSDLELAQQQKVFEKSYAVVFLVKGDKVIGVGRAISDGIVQAELCNIAVREGYCGHGLGKVVLDELLKQVKGCNVVLYTSPKHYGLYEHWGFSKLKTAYALFQDGDFYRENGFIE